MVMNNRRRDYEVWRQLVEAKDELMWLDRDRDEGHVSTKEYRDRMPVLGQKIKQLEEVCRQSYNRPTPAGTSCGECNGAPVYYPGEVHHVDGDLKNNSFGNLAMQCPICNSHVLLSRCSPRDVHRLKSKGFSYVEIGKLLGISKQRAWLMAQKCEDVDDQYMVDLARIAHKRVPTQEEADKLRAGLDELVSSAQDREKQLSSARGTKRRKTDRRTLRKKAFSQLFALGAKTSKGD